LFSDAVCGALFVNFSSEFNGLTITKRKSINFVYNCPKKLLILCYPLLTYVTVKLLFAMRMATSCDRCKKARQPNLHEKPANRLQETIAAGFNH